MTQGLYVPLQFKKEKKKRALWGSLLLVKDQEVGISTKRIEVM
jgi:hypothetical protein